MVVTNPIQPFPTEINRDQFGNWLSGFTDGEGCFGLYKYNPTVAAPCRYRARLSIGLRADDLPCLELIRSYLNCGVISVRKGKIGYPIALFSIASISDLHNIVVPHFERYPLRAKKSRDFRIWKQGVELIWHVYNRKKRDRMKWLPDHCRMLSQFEAELQQTRGFHC